MEWLSTWRGWDQINSSDSRQYSIEMSKQPTKKVIDQEVSGIWNLCSLENFFGRQDLGIQAHQTLDIRLGYQRHLLSLMDRKL